MRISHCFEDISGESAFAYREHHGTDTSLHSITEQRKMGLRRHVIIRIVSIDLSKAFVTLRHEFILPKLKSYGTDDKTIDQVYDYLSNHHPQRVRLGDQFSNWNEISARVPQGSVLSSLRCQTGYTICVRLRYADIFLS